MENLAEKLKEILGEKGWVTGAGAAPWQRDWLNRYGEMPLGVARPNSTAQVAQVMAACHAAGVVVVPQGGNTGLCGAAVLGAAGGGILQMSRMAAIAAPGPARGTLRGRGQSGHCDAGGVAAAPRTGTARDRPAGLARHGGCGGAWPASACRDGRVSGGA